jgi:hypothetical protein
MGLLYDAKVRIEAIIAEKNLNATDVKGRLSLKTGVLLALVNQHTPDDPVKVEKLRAAVRALLQAEL